jgi:hypothetical protein
MASLMPGYEYDIFISYRQKDNKGDRWVSEFVDALNTKASQSDHYWSVKLHLAYKIYQQASNSGLL